MSKGDFAITNFEMRLSRLTEEELLTAGLRQFGSSTYFVYAKKEVEDIIYYKWYTGEDSPKMHYIHALGKDNWDLINEIIRIQ